MSTSTAAAVAVDEPVTKKIKVVDDDDDSANDEITHILVIDIETTGPSVRKHYMPEFAASFWEISGQKPLATRHYTLQQPEGTEWDAETLSEFWNNPAKGEDKKTTPMEALKQRLLEKPPQHIHTVMHEFIAFALECDAIARGLLVIMFDTVEFDSTFMNYYLASWTAVPSLTRLFGGYRATRDIDSFYFGVGGRIKFWGAEEVALAGMRVADFPDDVKAYKATHHPLDDANFIGAKASYVLSMCPTWSKTLPIVVAGSGGGGGGAQVSSLSLKN